MNNTQSTEAGSNLRFKSEAEKMQKELDIRTWISRKECVGPYAPGLARFIHLPEINSLSMEHVYYFAQELKAATDNPASSHKKLTYESKDRDKE